MDYSNMRIQSDIKIKKAIRLIDERIELVTELKRELNRKDLSPENQKVYLILVAELVYTVLESFRETKHALS